MYPTLTRYSINTSSTYHRLIIIVSLHVPSSVLFDPAIAPWSSAVHPLHRRYRIVDDAIVNGVALSEFFTPKQGKVSLAPEPKCH